MVAAASAALVLLIAGSSWFVWQRMQTASPDATGTPPPAGAPSPEGRAEERLPVTVYLPENGMLAARSVDLRRQPEPQLQAREAAAAVLNDERSLQIPVLKDVRLRTLYLDPSGIAFLDLSAGQTSPVHASAWDELLALYALANTVIQTVPEVKQVRILLDGREARTLAGHIDLTRSFVRRPDLVRQQQ